MKPTDVMKEQIAMLENAVEGAIESNMPPIVSAAIIRSPIYNEFMRKVADVLFMYMDGETGVIDGKKAHETLSMMFPSITRWISVPQTNFLIADEVNNISKTLIGRNVL